MIKHSKVFMLAALLCAALLFLNGCQVLMEPSLSPEVESLYALMEELEALDRYLSGQDDQYGEYRDFTDPYEVIRLPEMVVEEQTQTDAAGTGLAMHVLEVGKADCIVLECDGDWMIVDGGNEDDEAYILAKLEELGVDEFRVLVNTHPHEDHLGALDAVVRAYDVKKAYLSPREHTTYSYERFLLALKEQKVPTKIPRPGTTFSLGGARITVLSPAKDAEYDGYNDWSIVLMCKYGDVRFLLMGDAETPVEGDLMERRKDLRADVLKIGHHGSATSSRKSFLEAVSPSYALITCDGKEEAGAPHEQVVQYLEDLGIPFLRTDENGMITVLTDGENVALMTERETVIR